METLAFPAELRAVDGRFGCGPSKVRPAQLRQLLDSPMGTSHRQEPVKRIVASIRERLGELFALPAGYEVILGNGGASAFWAVAATSLIKRRSAHAVFGEFGNKFATEIQKAPFLADPIVHSAPLGQLAQCQAVSEPGAVDAYAWPHHETSTGVVAPVERIYDDGALMLVDATSIAGGIEVDVAATDAYYFAGQKCFGSDGGIWYALLSPAALERAQKLAADNQRWMPDILNLSKAIANSRKNQTLNTPAIATLVLMDDQLGWMLENGSLAGMAQRARRNSQLVYQWAARREWAWPFVADEQWRSPVVATINFADHVDTNALRADLARAGFVDIAPYRSVAQAHNQLRIGTFPAIDEADVEKLLAAIDYWVDRSSGSVG